MVRVTSGYSDTTLELEACAHAPKEADRMEIIWRHLHKKMTVVTQTQVQRMYSRSTRVERIDLPDGSSPRCREGAILEGKREKKTTPAGFEPAPGDRNR